MYKVYANGQLLSPLFLSDQIHRIYDPTIQFEPNAINSFTFEIQADHPVLDEIRHRTTYITVEDDTEEIFRGRIVESERDLYNTGDIYVEHELAFLKDSTHRPFGFSGGVEEFFTDLIENHNSQVDEARQFRVGVVTVTDPNDYIVRSSKAATDTWTLIQEKLIGLLGGYIRTRLEDGVRYIDYIESYGMLTGQQVRFGENLLDIARKQNTAAVVTCLIPYGAEFEEESEDYEEEPENGAWNGNRLTIASVNDGKDYIENAAGIAIYGRVWGTNVWSDVTLPENLLSKGTEWLEAQVGAAISIEASVLDLHLVYPDIPRLKYGYLVPIYSEPHDISTTLQISKQVLHLDAPGKDVVTLGMSYSALTDVSGGGGGVSVVGGGDSSALIVANEAKEAAAAAQLTANAANDKATANEIRIEAVSETASKALLNADTANGNAVSALNVANKAATDVITAQNTADDAKDAAAAAQLTADQAWNNAGVALKNAENAQTTADNAQLTADTAKAKAEAAQNTANIALNNANSAYDLAQAAGAVADSAQTTADEANTKADTAQATADAAKLVAELAMGEAQAVAAVHVDFHQDANGNITASVGMDTIYPRWSSKHASVYGRLFDSNGVCYAGLIMVEMGTSPDSLPKAYFEGFHSWYPNQKINLSMTQDAAATQAAAFELSVTEFVTDNEFNALPYAGSSTPGGAANSVANPLSISVRYGNAGGVNSYSYNGSKASSLDLVIPVESELNTSIATAQSTADTALSQANNAITRLGSYLPLAGGTLTGAINLANGTWNKAGDDAYFGDNNTAGSFAIKGINGTTNLKMVVRDSTSSYGTMSYDGSKFAFSNNVATSGAVTVGNTVKMAYDSTNECLNFTFG